MSVMHILLSSHGSCHIEPQFIDLKTQVGLSLQPAHDKPVFFEFFYNKVSGNLLQALNDHQAVLKSISVSWRSLPLKVRQNAGSGHTGYSRHPACRNPPRTHRKAHLLKKKTTDYCKFEPVIKGKMQRIFCRKNKVNDLLQVNLFPKGF